MGGGASARESGGNLIAAAILHFQFLVRLFLRGQLVIFAGFNHGGTIPPAATHGHREKRQGDCDGQTLEKPL